MGNIGIWELVIIAILVIVIFGGKRLPELGRGLGKGLANFRHSVKEPDKTEPNAVSSDNGEASSDSKNNETDSNRQ